jgi:hypothetical protein
MLLRILLGAVMLILVLSFLFFVRLLKKNKQVDVENTEPRPIDHPDSPPIVKEGVRKYGEPCVPGDICIDGVSSAKPDNNGLIPSNYVAASVTTAFHPFFISEAGYSHIPMPSWWLMSETYSACAGMLEGDVLFLTTHGVYNCSPKGTIRLCESETPEGITLKSIHHCRGVIYTLAGGHIYYLLSEREYAHKYLPLLIEDKYVDAGHISKGWFWDKIQYLYGTDISHINVKRIECVRDKGRDILYLDTGEALLQHYKAWSLVGHIMRRGHYFDRRRDSFRVLSPSGDTIMRTAKGIVGTTIGKEATLFTINGDWLYRTGIETGNNTVRVSKGWTDLLTLEDGRLIGISSGVTYPL